MSELKVLENIAIKAVHRLRSETLNAGQPFMINVNGLPKNQCYLEFPDHSIQLVEFLKTQNSFIPVKTLSSKDRVNLMKRIGL